MGCISFEIPRDIKSFEMLYAFIIIDLESLYTKSMQNIMKTMNTGGCYVLFIILYTGIINIAYG